MAELDMAKLRELAKELGYWPASTDEESVERHRELNAASDYWLGAFSACGVGQQMRSPGLAPVPRRRRRRVRPATGRRRRAPRFLEEFITTAAAAGR
jgi:hypothetical protein